MSENPIVTGLRDLAMVENDLKLYEDILKQLDSDPEFSTFTSRENAEEIVRKAHQAKELILNRITKTMSEVMMVNLVDIIKHLLPNLDESSVAMAAGSLYKSICKYERETDN